jgi:hypothetical protein
VTYVLCPVCWEISELEGPDGVFVHLIAFHPSSDAAMFLMRELAKLPLPQREAMPSRS